MLRLLVPSVQPEEEASPTPGQHMPVTVAAMDLAGVPTAPFSASLLAGDVIEVNSTVITCYCRICCCHQLHMYNTCYMTDAM
jgi:hypothetical protein